MPRLLLVLLALLLIVPATAGAQVLDNPSPPAATTGAASEITTTATTVAGSVDPNGAETAVRFQYGTTDAYGLTSATRTLPAGDTAVDVTARLERLTASTTYHYRVLATNAAGQTAGVDRTFRTAANPSRPSVSTDAARDITLDAATLVGRVDPNRQATEYAFEYGTSTRYGTTTPVTAAGSGDAAQRVEARIGGLRPNTTYNFRIRATNATGTRLGSNRSFRTAKIPLAIRLATAPVITYGRTLTLVGSATGSDAAGLPLTVERRTFPFGGEWRRADNAVVTDSAGRVSVFVPPFTLSTQFRLVARTRGNVESNITGVGVRAFVRARARPSGKRVVRITGSVAPGGAVGDVVLQRRTADGRYITAQRRALRAAPTLSRFAFRVQRRSTPTTYRVSTRLSTGALVNGNSATLKVGPRR